MFRMTTTSGAGHSQVKAEVVLLVLMFRTRALFACGRNSDVAKNVHGMSRTPVKHPSVRSYDVTSYFNSKVATIFKEIQKDC